MPRHRTLTLILAAFVGTTLACIIPPDVLDAINRLPTPVATNTPVPSTILYVAKTGNDANDCASTATPCLTIMAALGKAADGAAIHIGPGTYAENDVRSLDSALVIYDQNVSLYGAASPGGYTTLLTGSEGLYTVVVQGDSRVVIERVAIIDSAEPGFGLFVTGGAGANVTLRNVEIRNNALAVRIPGAATVLLENVRITANQGGAISNSGVLTLRNSRVENNGGIAPGLGLGTSVIYNYGTLHLEGSTIASNEATENGAIHNTGGGSMTVERSTISANRVGRYAGIYNNMDSSLALVNSTVSGNSGVGVVSLGDLSLTSTTITANTLSGLYGNSSEADPMTLRLENSLIENNGEQDCGFQLGHSIVFDRRGRNLSDGSCDFDYGGLFARPPEGDFFLGPLADNGGPTQTHALLEGSRGIDTAEGPCLPNDQRGVARPVGGGCDVGAYEFTFALTAATPGASPIPIQTPTPTEAVPPLVILIQNANCRKGPGTGYDVLTSLSEGAQSPAMGRNEPATWWLVQVPVTDILCWISAISLQVPDDPSQVPVVTVQPVPGAPGAFQATQTTCSANLNAYPVELGWSDTSGETGYRLYRNSTLLSTLGANATSFTDQAPKATALTYEIEAFNTLGKSPRVTLSVPACP